MADPVAEPGQRDARNRYYELRLSHLLALARRNAKLIAALTVAGGLIAGLYSRLWQDDTYHASALLVVVPPKFASELMPSTLTVQGYQELLESDAVVHEANRQLAEADLLGSGRHLRVGRELVSSIFVSRRSEETSLAPMLRLETRAWTSELATAAANTWAEVFLDRTREVMGRATSAAVEFIEEQYPLAVKSLSQLEDQRVETANEFSRRLTAAGVRWERAFVATRSAAAEEIAAFRAETERLEEGLLAERTPSAREAHLSSLEQAYKEIQDELLRVGARVESKKLELEQVRRRVAETPPALALKKAITDEALWAAVAASEERALSWETLKDRTLLSEVSNPTYSALQLDLSRVETEVNVLVPREGQLAEQLAELIATFRLVRGEVASDRIALEKLRREREAGLEKLREHHSSEERVGKLERDEELDRLNRERETRLGQLDRTTAQQQKLVTDLSGKYNEALLARGQGELEDIRLGARAVASPSPAPQRTGQKTVLGLLLGCLLGLFAVGIREAWRGAS